MNFARLLVIIAFLSMNFAVAQSPPDAALKRADALMVETIPKLTLKEASFEDALDAVRHAWNERHPDTPLPIAITDFGPAEGYRVE